MYCVVCANNNQRAFFNQDGKKLSCDFRLDPTNPQTRGISYFSTSHFNTSYFSTSYFSIRPAEIKRLFPGCSFEFHKITLAPPLARRIVPLSWGLALFLEGLKIFNTHYLVAIRPLMTDN
jgi:hypothetical protein